MPFEYEELRAKTQRTLIDFIHTELEIGPTFAGSALRAKRNGHMDHYAQAKRSAVEAAGTVRRFMSRVADDTVRTGIAKQLSELDRLISSL